MELTSEQIVTKLLSEKEILQINKICNPFNAESIYNLGDYLEKIKSQPSPYGEKYVFIK